MSEEFDNKVLDLAEQKGFYPYECMSDFEKFKEELSSKEKFYSSLTVKKDDKEYQHVFNVRNKFEIETMKDYYDLYLTCVVLLLVDVFENFRNNSLKHYGLCPSHYLSASALS